MHFSVRGKERTGGREGKRGVEVFFRGGVEFGNGAANQVRFGGGGHLGESVVRGGLFF